MTNTSSMKARIVTITPGVAKEMLINNTHNRKVSESKVHLWAESMKRGEWTLNGEAIKIADDGTILDGQHRLYAVIESGVTIQSLVVSGLPKQSQETMDTGKQRTLADVLTLRGYRNATDVSGIVTGIIRWEKYSPKTAFQNGSGCSVTNGEAIQFIEQHPEVLDIPTRVRSCSKYSHIQRRILGVLYYEFGKVSPENVDFFFDKLENGADMSATDPILVLRNTIARLKNNHHGELNPLYVAAICIKAWNLYLDGGQCKLLRFTQGGASPEQFPKVNGNLDCDLLES